MARFYADENFPLPVVLALRGQGHDVLTTQESGMAGPAASDEEVLRLATKENRAVLTLNRRHFVVLSRRIPDHMGMVLCTVDADFENQAKAIDAAVRSVPDLKGQVLRVNRPPR